MACLEPSTGRAGILLLSLPETGTFGLLPSTRPGCVIHVFTLWTLVSQICTKLAMFYEQVSSAWSQSEQPLLAGTTCPITGQMAMHFFSPLSNYWPCSHWRADLCSTRKSWTYLGYHICFPLPYLSSFYSHNLKTLFLHHLHDIFDQLSSKMTKSSGRPHLSSISL